jgi:Fic family protein
MQERPVITAKSLAAVTGISSPAVNKGLEVLTGAGIVSEITGRRRNRVFAYREYLRILSEGTEPIPS